MTTTVHPEIAGNPGLQQEVFASVDRNIARRKRFGDNLVVEEILADYQGMDLEALISGYLNKLFTA